MSIKPRPADEFRQKFFLRIAMSTSHKSPIPYVPYTRTDIQAMVGGELQTYLPQKNKVILAGCFTKDAMNPRAPDVVQVGNVPKVVAKAVLLSQQPETVFPVFVKQCQSDKTYRFCGNYRFSSLSDDPDEIRAAERASGREGELAFVLRLKSA
jgi:hypothetical protein